MRFVLRRPGPPAHTPAGHSEIISGLKEIYKRVMRPLEEATKFDIFYSGIMTDAEFESAPMALLIGPYSVGKTTFIRYLLGRTFPGERIGPEPTTDRFMAVVHSEDDRTIPGNALTVMPGLPFGGLKCVFSRSLARPPSLPTPSHPPHPLRRNYGNNFLTRFEGSMVNAPVLKNLTLSDTPGVLSGEKQRISRNYDFEQVTKWFADRVDMIILLFDPFKLDVSDELSGIIRMLRGNEDKVRCCLNKSEQVSQQQLMRVYVKTGRCCCCYYYCCC